MYRPNRIGPWPVLDPSLAGLTWPSDWNTNFDGPDSGLSDDAVFPQVRSATVRDDFDQFMLGMTDLGSILATNQMMSFAVAVNGLMESTRPMLLSGHVFASVHSSLDDVLLAAWCGRADAASLSVTRTSAQNEVSNPQWLPGVCTVAAAGAQLSWSGSFVIEDQGEV